MSGIWDPCGPTLTLFAFNAINFFQEKKGKKRNNLPPTDMASEFSIKKLMRPPPPPQEMKMDSQKCILSPIFLQIQAIKIPLSTAWGTLKFPQQTYTGGRFGQGQRPAQKF